MRHASSPARAVAAVGFALTIAPVAASASFAGTTQAGGVEVLGTKTNKFDPVDVKAAPDAKGNITITLTSEAGGAPHTWENKQLGIDSGIVNAGQSKTFSFKAPPAGKHKIVCILHESVNMVGSLTVEDAGGNDAENSPTAAPSSLPPASASAPAGAGGGQGENAPPQGAHEEGEEGEHVIPGVAGNPQLKVIEERRAAEAGAVSGFKFFTFVCVGFLFILGAAILFSTRPRRAAR